MWDVVPPLGLRAGLAKRLCPLLELTALELPVDAGTTSAQRLNKPAEEFSPCNTDLFKT